MSGDSILDGIQIPTILAGEKPSTGFFIANSLFKLPKAVYLPRGTERYKDNESNLGKLLDHYLADLMSQKLALTDYTNMFSELKGTTEFIAEHSLHVSYGPLRSSAIDALVEYKKVSLHSLLI